MTPLVSGAWLHDHLDEVRVVDVRWYLQPGRSGRAEYEAGHILGAVFLDIDEDLSDPPSLIDGRHPLPSPERFAAALGRVGIATGTLVVAYDAAGGSTAARLWWLLHVLGEPVSVLDGGLAAWPDELTSEVPAVTPVHRKAVPWPRNRFVTADEVARTSAVVLDARPAARYRDGDPMIDPRPGHVPGARSAPWQENLRPDDRFRTPDELGRAYGDTGPFVAYCGSGITACHDLLALSVAGHDGTALYPGSWSQWGADPARPAERQTIENV